MRAYVLALTVVLAVGRGVGQATTPPGTPTYRGGEHVKPGAEIKTPGSPYAANEVLAPLGWIEATKNPFGIRLLDIRSLTFTLTSTTADMQIAMRFDALRSSDGQEHRGSTPSGFVETDCNLTYPTLGTPHDGPLFKARAMEDKWDIYLYDGYLYFARSWTGDLQFRAKIDSVAQGSRISRIESRERNKPLSVQQVDFLVKSHLLKQQVPSPLPPELPDDPQRIAIYSFSLFGRWASYATYSDTTHLTVPSGQSPGPQPR